MFARSSTIRHRTSGVSLQTPLLIPSFSSKGLPRSKENEKSKIRQSFSYSGEFLADAFLISAYDIFYEHIPRPREFPFTPPELIFLDSGGYEISTDSDYSSAIDPFFSPEPWDLPKLQSVLTEWPDEIPLVIVSYDHPKERKSVVKQLDDARRLFKDYPQHLYLFLLKPEEETQLSLNEALESLFTNATELGSFDLVGVTEKELGHTMLDRMVQIARLRTAMDNAGVQIPIHVFGSLDPITVCLYYLSGAELFDGLTWIRYGYDDSDRCVYKHNHGVLKYGISVSDDEAETLTLKDNYYRLLDLQSRLRNFESTGSWEKLSPHHELIRKACDSLDTQLNRRV